MAEFVDHIDVDSKQTVERMEDNRKKALLSYSMGADLHQAWRETRKKKDGTFEPRIKKTKDGDYIEAHNGQNEVDIANMTFEELPKDWQYENLEAAKVAINLVYNLVNSGTEITQEKIEEMSSYVHDEWLKRNQWVFDKEYGNETLSKSYMELPEEEKAKDREQILQAIEKVRSLNKGEIDLSDLEVKYGTQIVKEEK